MPVYEFKCEVCGEKFSELKKIGETQADCHVCGSANTKKLMSSFASSSSSSGFKSIASSGAGCSTGGG